MPPAYATLALLCLSTAATQRLVVVYDDVFDFSASGISQKDFHASATFVNLAAALNLTLEYHLVQPGASPDRRLLGSEGVVGVVSAGNCELAHSVLALEQKAKVPMIILEVLESCQEDLAPLTTTTVSPVADPSFTASPATPTAVLPLYAASISRRYPCLKYVAGLWLSLARAPAHPVVRFRFLPPRLEPREEYLSCAKEELPEGSPTVQEEGTPWSVQLYRARRYLKGRKLTVVTIQRPPFVDLKMVGEEIIGAEGFCIEMLNEIATKFNFTYRLVLSYDGNWGAPMENGTFNGMVGMVHRKTVDFAVASFTITQIRETVIDFTHAYYEEPTTILIPPPREQTKMLAFLQPFSWQVWFLTLASILVVGPLMWVLASVGDLPALYPHDTRRVHFSILRYTWDCAFALAGQSARTRHTEPVRVLHGVWWTFAVILIYTYTGTLIAFLTVPRLTSLINSLEELANQKEVLWTYRAKTAHETLFATASPPSTYHKIGMLLKRRPDLLVQTDDEGLRAVLRGDTAFIKEKSWLDFAMERDYLATRQCRMAQVNQLFFSAGFGWALQEHSVYLQLFNSEILKMSQSGLFTIWRMKYWPTPNECTAGNHGAPVGPRSLQLKDFSGHFFIFGVGLGLAALSFVVEWICLSAALRDAKSGKDEGHQVLLTREGSRGQHRWQHNVLMQGPVDRLHQLRAVALKNSSPLVTVIPTTFLQSHPKASALKLHPPPATAEDWHVLDATLRRHHGDSHHQASIGTKIKGRLPIR